MKDTRYKMRVTSHEPRVTNKAFTLMEMTVVIATVALLVVFGLPAVRTFLNSFESQGGARTLISATLASARAIAAKEQHYAGIRFQKAYHPDGPLNASQYMIFIVHDFDKTNLANGFRAIQGLEPIKLPDSVGVMEFVDSDSDIDDDGKLMDKTAFSIIFSPSGKLVIHPVQVRRARSKDDIFNIESNVDKKIGMFLQDDYSGDGLKKEPSRNSFIIYNRTEFVKVDESSRYSDYLKDLEVIHINPYTGAMINK